MLSATARALVAAWILALLAPPATAQGVIDRVRQSGVLKAGTRADAVPFAFRGDDGALIGFSVDVLGAVRARLEQVVGRSVALDLAEVTPQTRIALVRDGVLAIECGITTATWEREASIDFSIPFFENGTRILALRTAARSLADLRGRRIGVLPSSTTAAIVRRADPDAVVVEVETLAQGIDKLVGGEIDGLANVGIVLRAQIEALEGKSRFVMLPRGQSMSWESLSCILPQDDSAWRDLVNRAIYDLLGGIDGYSGPWMDIYERWFGVQGTVYYPLDQETAQRLAASRSWLE